MKKLLLATALATTIASVSTAEAAVTWTTWASGATGATNGSATGAMGGVSVTYSGEMDCLNCYASDWSPGSTWANEPPPYNSGIQLWGAQGATDTITFSSPVTNPIMAIVSLGNSGAQASFDFTSTELFVLEGGGQSNAWGGGALTQVGQIVYGAEGNGLVQFLGTYSSISWTNPTYEYYYAATIGSAVPEPATWAVMGLGFAGLAFAGYRRGSRTRAALA